MIGGRIEVMDNEDAILTFLQSREGIVEWVVQKYIENPLLLEGGRKFDIRCWIILDQEYNVWMYKEGVLRTTCVPFSLSDLSDAFVHLSNHCIQINHPDYGKYEVSTLFHFLLCKNECWLFPVFFNRLPMKCGFLNSTYGSRKRSLLTINIEQVSISI
jgi:hypothetical protein